MIVTILSILLFLIFIILSGFHFFWLLGGEWGLEKVIPSIGNEKNSLSIPKAATFMVALVLCLFGFAYLIKSNIFIVALPKDLLTYTYWFIPVVFIVRAIGDFKYVGFFKKITQTKFAEADSKIFSPLCIGIGIVAVLIQLLS